MGIRIDIALTQRGLCKSRSRAKALLLENKILLNGQLCTKPSVLVEDYDDLQLAGADLAYVGRGGLKLEAALDHFGISMRSKICMDIGASTGGFTDCMLQRGAALVYAVDVGHGQLDEKLCAHPGVINMEGTDIRAIQPEMLKEQPTLCSIDVSFISLQLVMPAAYALLTEQAECVALIKPQFEAGRSNLNKHGIVKSAKVHCQVLEQILTFASDIGFTVAGLLPSPIHGGSGNTEYLVYLKKGDAASAVIPDIWEVVRLAGVQG